MLKLISVKAQEEYLKKSLGRHMLVFASTWLGTKDLLIALALTAIFNVFVDYLLNEESKLCIVPKKYRNYKDILDLDGDGVVSDEEIKKATEILRQAKEIEKRKKHIKNISNFNY